jgi:hypothetical protein
MRFATSTLTRAAIWPKHPSPRFEAETSGTTYLETLYGITAIWNKSCGVSLHLAKRKLCHGSVSLDCSPAVSKSMSFYSHNLFDVLQKRISSPDLLHHGKSLSYSTLHWCPNYFCKPSRDRHSLCCKRSCISMHARRIVVKCLIKEPIGVI